MAQKPKVTSAPVKTIIAAAVGTSASGEKGSGAARIQQAMADAAAQAHRDNITDPEKIRELMQAARFRAKNALKAGEQKYLSDSERLDRSNLKG